MGKKIKMLISFTISVMLGTSLFVGCGKASSNGGEDSAKKEDTTITVAASQNWIKDIDRELANEFTEETGIKIDFQVNPDDQYVNVVKTKLATGEGPDIWLAPSGAALAQYLPEKYALDLSNEEWVSELKDWAKNTASVNGKLYGLNIWAVDGNAVLYNTKIFEENNLSIPKNYKEFTEVCDTLLAKGITPIYELPKDIWHQQYWLEGISANPQINDPDFIEKLNTNEIKFSDVPEFKIAIEQLNEISEKGYFGKDFIANTWADSYEAMGTGKAAMIVNYTTYQNEIQEKYPESNAKDWKMFPVPLADNKGFSLSAGGIIHLANKDSKNVDAIKKYFDFLTKNENLQKFYDARTDLNEPSFKSVKKETSNGFNSIIEIVGENNKAGVEAVVNYYDGMKVGELMTSMFIKDIKPEDVLKGIDEERQKTAKVVDDKNWK